MLVFISFLAGLPTAWAWGEYILALERRKACRAAVWDFVIGILGYVVGLTLWAMSGDNWWVLLSFCVGNALGTYCVVRWAK